MTTATKVPSTNGKVKELPAADTTRKVRTSHLQWVKINDIIPSPVAQRVFRPGYADTLAASFELEKMGFPVVSHRGGVFYCVDGQHRLAALRTIGFGDDTIQVECYEFLTEAEEAELFLGRNASVAVSTWDKFRVGLNAGREEDLAIDRLVRAQDLHISYQRIGGGISAIVALRNAYRKNGPGGFSAILRILRDAYGDGGLDGVLIDGMSLCLQRYGDQIVEPEFISRLAKTPGGLNGLRTPAEKMHIAMGQPRAKCIAACAVDIYNSNRPAKTKLPAWWK